jgi:hypothetical protein
MSHTSTLTMGHTTMRAPPGSFSGGRSTMAEYGRRSEGIIAGSLFWRAHATGAGPRWIIKLSGLALDPANRVDARRNLSPLDALHRFVHLRVRRRRDADLGAALRDVAVDEIGLGAAALRMSWAIDGRCSSERVFAFSTRMSVISVSASLLPSARAAPSVSGSMPSMRSSS